MPTVVTNGGRARTIGATFSGVTKRGVFSTKMKPSASAPASTAVIASSRLVMPQILTRVIDEWGGRDAPPISPPARGAPGSRVPLAPWCAPGGGAPGSRVLLAPWCAPGGGAPGSRVLLAPWCAPGGAAPGSRVLLAPWCAPGGAAPGSRVLLAPWCALGGAAPGSRVLLAPRCFRGAPGSRVLLAPCSSRVHQGQLSDLRGNVGRADEALADEDRVGAGDDDLADVGRGEEAALADHDRAERDQRQELERGRDPRLERSEIAVVDPDDAAADRERLVHFGGGVALDQRREAESLRGGEQLREPRGLEDRDDQEHRVGAGRARLPELVLVDREVLAQERHVDRRAYATQIVEAPLEVFLVGEDRDRVGAVARVRGGEGDRIEAAREDAARRRGLLHLGDQADRRRRRAERAFEIARGGCRVALPLERRARHGGLPPGHLSARVGGDLVEDRHSSALEIAPEPLPSQRVERDRPELVEHEVADRARGRQIADDAPAADERLEQGFPGAAVGRALPGGHHDGLARALPPVDFLGSRPLTALGLGLALDFDDVEGEVEHRSVGDRRPDPVAVGDWIQGHDLVLVDATGGEDLHVVVPAQVELPAHLFEDPIEVTAARRRRVEPDRIEILAQ